MKTAVMTLLAAALVSLAAPGRASAAQAAPAVGTKAPLFILKSQAGKPVNLKDFRGHWVVLYFYPKDFTRGCTIEAHNFQRDLPEYRKRDAVIVGVSVQTADSHKDFCAKEGLGFTLLADTDKAVSTKYDSLMDFKLLKLSARHTFLIDPEGVIRQEYLKVDPNVHSAEVLAELDKLQGAASKR